MNKAISLIALICIATSGIIQSDIQRLTIRDKVEFLKEPDIKTLDQAVKQIKWRIKSGYLAELNDDHDSVHWIVKKLAERFNVKTTSIATKLGTVAAKQYVKNANLYMQILAKHGEKEAAKYKYDLYPEFDADGQRPY